MYTNNLQKKKYMNDCSIAWPAFLLIHKHLPISLLPYDLE